MVPPANIAGDELSIEGLAAARRAGRAAQKAAKAAGQPPPAAKYFVAAAGAAQGESQAGRRGRQTTAWQRRRARQEAEAAATAAAGDAVVPSQEAEASVDEAEEVRQDGESAAEAASNAQPTAETAEFVPETGTAGDQLEHAALPASQKLQQQLGSLGLASSSLPEPPPSIISRSGHTVPGAADGARQQDSGAAEAARQQAEPAEKDSHSATDGSAAAAEAPDLQTAQPSASTADNAAAAASDREASRNAWQRIVDSMATGSAQVRDSNPWKALQSLPQALPKPWQQQPQPSDDCSPASAQQLMAAEINALEFRPTARHVLPEPWSADPADRELEGDTLPAHASALPSDSGEAATASPAASPDELTASRRAGGFDAAPSKRAPPASSPAQLIKQHAADSQATGAAQRRTAGQHDGPPPETVNNARSADRELRLGAWEDHRRMRQPRFGPER